MTLPSCLASSSRPTLARMIFCSVVMVSSNAPRRGASPPRPLRARLGSRFSVGTGHLCQIKFCAWARRGAHLDDAIDPVTVDFLRAQIEAELLAHYPSKEASDRVLPPMGRALW